MPKPSCVWKHKSSSPWRGDPGRNMARLCAPRPECATLGILASARPVAVVASHRYASILRQGVGGAPCGCASGKKLVVSRCVPVALHCVSTVGNYVLLRYYPRWFQCFPIVQCFWVLGASGAEGHSSAIHTTIRGRRTIGRSEQSEKQQLSGSEMRILTPMNHFGGSVVR